MKTLLSWAQTFEGEGHWPAPAPDAAVFRATHSELLSELASLPAPLEESTRAALTLHEKLRFWLFTAESLARPYEDDEVSPNRRTAALLGQWWKFVGVIEPAKTKIDNVIEKLKQSGVTISGNSAWSAHCSLLDFATKYSVGLLQKLGFVGSNADGSPVDPSKVCRTPSSANTASPAQLIQDFILSHSEQLFAEFPQPAFEWYEELEQLKQNIIEEANNAARQFDWSRPGQVFRVKVRPEWDAHGPSVDIDGKPMVVKKNEWTLLSALDKRRPFGLAKDEMYETNGNAWRLLAKLKKNWEDSGLKQVIVFPKTRGKGGYQLK